MFVTECSGVPSVAEISSMIDLMKSYERFVGSGIEAQAAAS